MYTSESVKYFVSEDSKRLFGSYAVNKPANWACDQQTRDFVCLSIWLREELTRIGIDELGRKTQEAQFNRYSRSTDDLFGLAAGIMNDAVAGEIDRDRKTHRRWG